VVKRRFFCRRCQRDFVLEVLEPGEAEKKKVPVQAVRCPECGGPVEQA
jgi:transposase-like protein